MGKGDGTDAGNRREAFQQCPMKCGDLVGLVSGESCIGLGEQQMGSFESIILVLQVAQGAQKETGHDQEQEGDHDLRRNQRFGQKVRQFAAAALDGARHLQ